MTSENGVATEEQTFTRSHIRGRLRARGFNDGSDARWAGWPVTACPYRRSKQPDQWTGWHEGWHHMNLFWSRDVKERWLFLKLRPVFGS